MRHQHEENHILPINCTRDQKALNDRFAYRFTFSNYSLNLMQVADGKVSTKGSISLS